jgi:hypothetical protein
VIDAKDVSVLGTIVLGGVTEQGVADGKGILYVVIQDMPGSVTAVAAKTMKAVAPYPFRDKGRCNRLALDAKNRANSCCCLEEKTFFGGDPTRAESYNVQCLIDWNSHVRTRGCDAILASLTFHCHPNHVA